ncbi:MAG: alpha/beta hydrolase [Eubacteriaceae bacterium]|nr:alpha/beta hydrolase [Eubacteriaceae bacterium]
MGIKMSMIHPDLRVAAQAIKIMLPKYTKESLKSPAPISSRLLGKASSKLSYEQVYIKRKDGTSLRLCVYGPRKASRGVPGLLWLHGGGYALGVPEQDEPFIRKFIEASKCIAVAPDYTLSGTKPFPAAFDDGYEALLWLSRNGEKYGMNSEQIFVGGDSAGGGLAAAICLCARDRGEVSVAFQMPLYPMLDDRPTASNTGNEAPVWDSDANSLAWQQYLAEAYETGNVSAYAAPARAHSYENLPPAATFVGSLDPFHDETIAYVENLRANGIEVRFKVFEGCFHAFDIFGKFTKVGKEANAFIMDAFNYAVSNYFAKQPGAASNKLE